MSSYTRYLCPQSIHVWRAKNPETAEGQLVHSTVRVREGWPAFGGNGEDAGFHARGNDRRQAELDG